MNDFIWRKVECQLLAGVRRKRPDGFQVTGMSERREQIAAGAEQNERGPREVRVHETGVMLQSLGRCVASASVPAQKSGNAPLYRVV
jgi:hypothetical protein